jgi:transcription antitermination factor NusG
MAVAWLNSAKKGKRGQTQMSDLVTGAESPGFPWFALQVRTKHEMGVADFLRGRGYMPFLPVRRTRKVWSDRTKVVDTALFPGYLFCRVNIQDRLPVLTAPGVIRIVGYDRVPVPVDEAEIKALQTLVTSEVASQPWPFLRIGEQVQIESGPLQGLKGILLEVRGTRRLVLSVSLLQRSVAVEIDIALVKSLGSGGQSLEKDARTEGRQSLLVGCGH